MTKINSVQRSFGLEPISKRMEVDYTPPRLVENLDNPQAYIDEVKDYMRRVIGTIQQKHVAQVMGISQSRMSSLLRAGSNYRLDTIVRYLDAVRQLLGDECDRVISGSVLQDQIIAHANAAMEGLTTRELTVIWDTGCEYTYFLRRKDKRWNLYRVKLFLESRVRYNRLNTREVVHVKF